MILRRFEVGNAYDDRTEGILSYPEAFIDMNKDEYIYLKWVAIFEDKLPAPPSRPIYKDNLQMIFNLDDWNRFIEEK